MKAEFLYHAPIMIEGEEHEVDVFASVRETMTVVYHILIDGKKELNLQLNDELNWISDTANDQKLVSILGELIENQAA